MYHSFENYVGLKDIQTICLLMSNAFILHEQSWKFLSLGTHPIGVPALV